MSAETRKQRKENRAKKDRRSLKGRHLSRKAIANLAKLIVDNAPPLIIQHKLEYCYCEVCRQTFCVMTDGFSKFCRECHWIKFNPEACLKRQDAPIKFKCDHCGRRAIK